MKIRVLFTAFSLTLLSAQACLAQQRICPDAEYIVMFYKTRAYKATGKIYFLKKCSDSETLCKTGSYIIAGDYFIAAPKANDYYCAAYIPDGYKHPKAVGLIKNENFSETDYKEYAILRYNSPGGFWKSERNGIERSMRFLTYPDNSRFINRVFAQGDSKRRDQSSSPYPLDGNNVFKIGAESFAAQTSDGVYDIWVKSGKLILNNYGSAPDPQWKGHDYSGIYTFAAPPKNPAE